VCLLYIFKASITNRKLRGVFTMLRKDYYKIVLVMLVGIAFLFAGCTDTVDDSVIDEVEEEITEEGIFLGGELIADQATYDAALQEGKVVFYTAHSLAQEEEMIRAFMTRFPEINVELTRAGGSTLHEKIMTEQSAGELKADIVLNSDTNYLKELLDEGWLLEHYPPSMDLYPEDSMTAGYIYPTGASAILIAYHTELVAEEDAPKDWADLGDTKWNGILGGQRLGGGAMWSMVAYIRSELGPEIFEAWGGNNPIMQTSGSGLATALVAGEYYVTPMGLYSAYPAKYQQGAPIEIVWPESGFPLYIPTIAIMNLGENPNAAKLFINWYLSADGQSRLANVRGQFSLREDVLPAPYLPSLQEVNAHVVDPEIFLDAELRDQWISEATAVFGWE